MKERYQKCLELIRINYPDMQHLTIPEYNRISNEIISGRKTAVNQLATRMLPALKYVARVFARSNLKLELFLDFLNEVIISLLEHYKRKAGRNWFVNYYSFVGYYHAKVDRTIEKYIVDFSTKVEIKQPYYGTKISVERCQLDEVLDDLPDDSHMVFELLAKEVLKDLVLNVLDTLTPREEMYISLWFGLKGDPLSMTDIAKRWNFSKSRVSQIIARALRKLRDPERTEDLHDFYE